GICWYRSLFRPMGRSRLRSSSVPGTVGSTNSMNFMAGPPSPTAGSPQEDRARPSSVERARPCDQRASSYARSPGRSRRITLSNLAGGDQAGAQTPPKPAAHHLDLVATGVLHAQRVIRQLDHVPVRVMKVGVVLAAVLPSPLVRIGAAEIGGDARPRTPPGPEPPGKTRGRNG